MRKYRVTDRLLLRAPVAADAPLWFAVMQQPETRPHLYEGFKELAIDELVYAFGAPRSSIWLSIFESTSNDFVGFCGLSDQPVISRSLDAFYYLQTSKMGMGYAEEALRALIEIGLREQNIDQVTALMDSENFRSARTAKNSGMAWLGELYIPKRDRSFSLFSSPDAPHVRVHLANQRSTT